MEEKVTKAQNSYVQMEQSLIKNYSLVTGGTMWIVMKQLIIIDWISIPSIIRIRNNKLKLQKKKLCFTTKLL